jgi:hypothetical protein
MIEGVGLGWGQGRLDVGLGSDRVNVGWVGNAAVQAKQLPCAPNGPRPPQRPFIPRPPQPPHLRFGLRERLVVVEPQTAVPGADDDKAGAAGWVGVGAGGCGVGRVLCVCEREREKGVGVKEREGRVRRLCGVCMRARRVRFAASRRSGPPPGRHAAEVGAPGKVLAALPVQGRGLLAVGD